MPFGLDLKSMVIGAVIAYFLVPRLIAAVTSMRTTSQSA